MKRINHSPLAVSLLALAIQGCGLNTDLSIKEQPIPASYQTKQDASNAANVADINWREYFTDNLLLKLIDTAIANNLDLQMALQRINVARSSIKLANGALLPKVDVAIGGGMRKFGLYTMDGAGNASTFITPGQVVPENLPDIFVGLQSSWEVDIWGKLHDQRRSAVSSYLASVEGTNFVISNLVADVAIHYNDLLALDNELDILRQTIQTQEEALEVIKLQKDAGRANELAVKQFYAQHLNMQALEKNILQQITETENRLNFLLGRFPQPIERSKEDFFKPALRSISEGIPSQLLENRPDIRAAEFEIEATKFDLKAAKAAFYPNFNMTATFGFQAFNPEFLFSSPASIAYSVMGSLIAPLINMKALEAKFNTAQANQLSAMYNYQKTILNAYVEVANQLANIKNLGQINALKNEQSKALKQSVDISKDLYRSAKATYLEILITQQNALQSNIELINATRDQRIAKINLYKALGGGWK
ncbi:efflux transporter outer membrane subunit [Methylomonas methanica]|uniref:RND efflux system, outer membrane lipoprotein, NodT family n=1 Tax=Methylomonas methanica (strain DSM 25384 / MC09) TaxID=857087 RepID=F9ZXX5_METMM|nr:efflux transporter outer membrane subunit [Methylomonas methanica]AEF98554.1 RND efflux system, outer membrane lipoprotein, NodT family [Methylomonas methanica MC09]